MSLDNEIMKAIGAHGAWKMRLKSAIEDGKSNHQPATVAQDDQCEFGKWMATLPPDQQDAGFRNKVRHLHADFHKEAARVLGLALQGKKADAEKSLAQGGAFVQLSTQLSTEMMAWKSSAKG